MRIDRIKLVTELTKRNMTQKQLAELAGVSRVTVNGVQNGRSCSGATAVKIAAALGLPLETLLEK